MSIQDELIHAIWREDVAEVARLLQSGADPNGLSSKEWTPLMQAAEMENIELVELLLRSGADPNVAGEAGSTPLHLAVDIACDGTIQAGGRVEEAPTHLVARLLAAGASVAARNAHGESALDWARGYRCEKLVALLAMSAALEGES
jgi:ankyrin repeat protein